MGLIPKSHLSYLSVTLLIFSSSSLFFCVNGGDSSTPSPTPTVYEILPKYGLPSGLLPDSVTSYKLEEDGSFEVYLKNPCYVDFDYSVYYEKKITGKLSIGSITKLEGIQVQRFFFWFDVDEIKVDLPPSDSIYFTVGIINKKLDVDQFKTVHTCKNKALELQAPTSAGEDDENLLLFAED